MEIRDNLEDGLEDLDKLNELYNKGYMTLEEWYTIKNRIIATMIDTLNKDKKINDIMSE